MKAASQVAVKDWLQPNWQRHSPALGIVAMATHTVTLTGLMLNLSILRAKCGTVV